MGNTYADLGCYECGGTNKDINNLDIEACK